MNDTGPEPAPADANALIASFETHLDEHVRTPLVESLERYREALTDLLERFRDLTEDERPARTPSSRYAYAQRFVDTFESDLLDRADRERAAFFSCLDALGAELPELPELATLGAAQPGTTPADTMVRPGLGRRIRNRIRRRDERKIPVRDLARLYVAEVADRIEGAASTAASLESIALAYLRRELHRNVDPPRTPALATGLDAPAPDGLNAAHGPIEPGVDAGVADAGVVDAGVEARVDSAAGLAETEIEAVVAAATDAFARAVHAPAVAVDRSAAEEKLERAGKRRTRLLEDWRSFEEALRANTASEAVLARALASLDTSAVRAASELDEAIAEHARAPLDELADALRALAQGLSERLAARDFTGAIETLRDETERRFEARVSPLGSTLRAEIQDIAERFVAALGRLAETVPDGLHISAERIDGIPARPERLALRDAPLDQLLRAACEGAIPRWVERSLVVTEEEIDALSRELDRVRDAVDFHIRAPLRGDFSPEEAAELISDAMERGAAQLEELRDSGLDAMERLVPELERLSAEEARAVRVAVRDREFLRMASDIAEEQAVQQLSSGMVWARRLVESGLRLARRGWSTGRRTYDRTQDWAERQLGVGEIEREEMLDTLEESLLGEEGQQLAIPGLYRQLFDVEGEVPWEELLVAREPEVAVLERALNRWRRGQPASVAVMGEKGSGKTTLLRMAGDLLGDVPVRTIQLGSTVTEPAEAMARIAAAHDLELGHPGELVSALKAGGVGVVIVEDVHHLFIRALGGFDAMEALLELVAATGSSVFWVITMDEYAWRYLDRVLGMAPHFTHVINTTSLSAEKLEQAVMARHEVSGFGLRFEGIEERSATGWWGRLRGRETGGELSRREAERQAFFRQLNQIAGGNIFLALFYWLRSVERVDDHVLVMRRPRIMELEFLERLPLPSLHTIAAIILHGGLSQSEHERIFHLDRAESRLQLASLADSHLIFRSIDGEYKINKVLYRPLIRLLEGKNIF